MQELRHGKVSVMGGTEPKLNLLNAAQICRIVKLCTFILLAGCLHAYATGYGQKITLSEKDVPLTKVFKEIKKQTGYQFLYISEQLEQANKVTIAIKDASLEEVLEYCFREQPLGFEIKDKTVIVRPKLKSKDTKSQDVTVSGDPIDVSGKVTDGEGRPLPGANVKVRGGNNGVTTDGEGRFVLKNVFENSVLEITYVGHEMKTFTVRGAGSINIALNQKLSLLDETVVIAYGQTTRRFATGNVSSVKASDIEKQPVNNPLLALQGRVPGLLIAQSSGIPGAAVKVQIQGQNSIKNGNTPLYVVDGVPYFLNLPRTGIDGPLSANGEVGNPLSYINPADIESIDVLKDADATSIYGSRAANGAILITTKQGKAGRMKLHVNIQKGWGQITKKMDVLNTRQYLDMRYEALSNDGLSPSSNPSAVAPYLYAPDLTIWDTTRYTDWQEDLIGGTAQYTRINASVSGGTQTVQYMVGGTWQRETTVFPGNSANRKGSLHFNLNSVSANQKFHLQLTANYMHDNNALPSEDATTNSFSFEPVAPSVYNEDGTLNWAPNAAGASTWSNPFISILMRDYENTTKNLVTNAMLSYVILPGLEIKSSFGYTDIQTNTFMPTPIGYIKPENRATSLRQAFYGKGFANSWIVEPQVTFKKIIGKGMLDGLLGASVQQSISKSENITGLGYNSDLVLKDMRSAASLIAGTSNFSMYKYNALFGRLNYTWNNKYIINLTTRRDGSSRFGDKNKFHNFGSVGAAWIFTEEKLLKNKPSFLSFGKVRNSYGTTGNDQIADYYYLSLYGITTAGLAYQNIPSLYALGLNNPYLQWEETRKWQIGIDLGFFKDRILLNSSWSRNRSSNQLITYVLPAITGNTSINENFPALIQNIVWEVALSTVNVKRSRIMWKSNFNVTVPRNKLVAFPGIEKSVYTGFNGVIIGQPLGIQRVFHFLGVDPISGYYQFADKDGNPTLTPSASTDRNMLISTLPKFYGGFENSVTYKGWQLDFLFQFVKQKGYNKLNYYNGYVSPGEFFAGASNQPISVLSRWVKIDDNATIQRFNTNTVSSASDIAISRLALSNAGLGDASFIRLKNVSLSWQIPNRWLQKVFPKVTGQSGRLYFQGQNLLTLTKFKGLDPENNDAFSYRLPPLRMLTIGMQVDL